MPQVQDRLDLRRRLVEIARGQAGYFTTAQALAAGYSYSAQRYHVHRGNWEQVDRALFRLPEWPIERWDYLVRWSLWSGGRAVVSHETALVVHDLGDVNPARIHLTVPPGFRMQPRGLVIHQRELLLEDVEDWGGFRITTPVRSVADVAATPIELDQLATVVDDALRRDLFSRRRLREQADAVGPKSALAVERALDLVDAHAV